MKKFKKLVAAVVAGTMVMAAMAVSAFAADGDCAYTDGKSPSYTYEVKGDVTEITANVNILIPLEGDGTAWNDWCGEGVKVTNPDGTVAYYQWGGKEVSWSADFDGDKEDDSKDGVNGDTWLGTVADGKAELKIPVGGAGTKVDFYVFSWDGDDTKPVQYNVAISGDAADAPADDTPSGDSAATTAVILAAIAALAVVATVSVKKVAVER